MFSSLLFGEEIFGRFVFEKIKLLKE